MSAPGMPDSYLVSVHKMKGWTEYLLWCEQCGSNGIGLAAPGARHHIDCPHCKVPYTLIEAPDNNDYLAATNLNYRRRRLW